jgi:hypothetical protein
MCQIILWSLACWESSALQASEVDQREFFLGESFQLGKFESLGRAQTTDLQIGFLDQEDAILDATSGRPRRTTSPPFHFYQMGRLRSRKRSPSKNGSAKFKQTLSLPLTNTVNGHPISRRKIASFCP